MFTPFVRVSYTDRESFFLSNYSKSNPTQIIFIEGSSDGTVPAEIWANDIKYANCTTSYGLTAAQVTDIVNQRITYYIDENSNGIWDWKENQSASGGGLTETDVRNIVNSMIDKDNSDVVDWEEHTIYYVTNSGDDGAWGNYE